MAFDVIIRGGEVIDGKGSPRRKADVGIKGDTIVAIGDLSSADARRVIDATAHVVTPGFIDMHSHADQTILEYPAGESSLGQGITTTVGGNCGFSIAPLNRHYTACFWEWNWWDRVAPRKYYQEVVGDLDKAKKAAMEVDGLDINWSTFAEWLDRVEAARPGLNLVPLVGHSTVRTAVMGTDYRRHATPDEIKAMKSYVDEAMDAGAFGISNGLDYAPNSYCAMEESYEVIGAAAKKGGIFASHWRRTGLRQGFGNPGLAVGLQEAIDIAKKTGAKLEIAHLSPGYLVTPSATPKLAVAAAEETLLILDQAIKDGVDLTFDCIPNITGGVLHGRYLAALLTPWLKEAGSLEQFARNLQAPDLRQEIRDYIMSGKWYNLNPILQPGWARGIKIIECKKSEYVGMTLAAIAEQRGQDALDALMDIVVIDPYTRPGSVGGVDEAKKVFFNHPLAMVGIDVFLLNPTYEVRVPPYFLPHPNTFGGMARFIRMYAIGQLGLEEGIRRLTSLPAKTLGIKDRGVLEEGMKADIVVMNPNAVKETGDDFEPRRYPEGFKAVLVNGVIAMDEGKLTGARGGRVLRR